MQVIDVVVFIGGRKLSLTCPIAIPRVAGDWFQQKLMKGHVVWVWPLSGTLLSCTQQKVCLATSESELTAELTFVTTGFKTPLITVPVPPNKRVGNMLT